MSTRALTITLSDEYSDLVRAQVASGDYDSEVEVVEDGVLALSEAGDPASSPAFARWVEDELRPAIAAHEADPTSGISLEEFRAHLAKRHARRLAGG